MVPMQQEYSKQTEQSIKIENYKKVPNIPKKKIREKVNTQNKKKRVRTFLHSSLFQHKCNNRQKHIQELRLLQ